MSKTEATPKTEALTGAVTFDNLVDTVMHVVNGPVGTTGICQPDELSVILGAPVTTFVHLEGGDLHISDSHDDEVTQSAEDVSWVVAQLCMDQRQRQLPPAPEGFFNEDLVASFNKAWAEYDAAEIEED